MAFTPETGDGIIGANAYMTVAEVNAYHTDRGNATWTGSNIDKQRAIVRATDYIDKRFARKFRGTRLTQNQGLAWPRLDAFDNSDFLIHDVPKQIKNACAEYALRALIVAPEDLAPDSGTAVGDVQSISTTVGPISESKTFATAQSRSAQSSLVGDTSIPQYPAADLWIEELIMSSGQVRVVRG